MLHAIHSRNAPPRMPIAEATAGMLKSGPRPTNRRTTISSSIRACPVATYGPAQKPRRDDSRMSRASKGPGEAAPEKPTRNDVPNARSRAPALIPCWAARSS